MTARDEILRRIRHSVGDNGASLEAEFGAIPRAYKQAGSGDRAEVLSQFIGRLRDYDSGVYRCGAGEIAATVASAMEARGKRSLLRPANLPNEWLPSALRFPMSEPDGNSAWYDDIDRSEGVITGCLTAIAFTGTIILRHEPRDGRRALTLIPDYHLCVVFADQVVETVPEGFARLKGSEALPITTISGPSATADIEMTRVKGVHGPRFLDVILVD